LIEALAAFDFSAAATYLESLSLEEYL
jgi:hypothetical protein